MVQHSLHRKGRGCRKALAINLTGAIAAAAATVVLAITKFTHGAWVVVFLIPVLIAMFRKIRWHYRLAECHLSMDKYERPPTPSKNIVIMPISGVDGTTAVALDNPPDTGEDSGAGHTDAAPAARLT